MYGIKETKEVVGFALSLGEGLAAVLDDGVSLGDALKFIEAARRAPAALSDLSMVPKEITDLDESEKAELKAFVAEDFDIPQEGIETAVKAALIVAIELSEILKLLKKGE